MCRPFHYLVKGKFKGNRTKIVQGKCVLYGQLNFINPYNLAQG